MNLISLAEQLSGNEEVAVAYDAHRCLHHGDKFSDCAACYDVCPEGAIQAGRPPVLDSDACRYCRACLPVCPTGAYTMEDELPDLLRCASRLHQDAFEIICQHHPDPQRGPGDVAIRIRGCLAGLGATSYLQLAARSANHIIIRADVCEGCPWSHLTGQIQHQVEQASQLLQAWQRGDVLHIQPETDGEQYNRRPVYPAHSPPVSRRSLFRLQPDPAEETAPLADGHHPFRERLRLLDAIRSLPDYDAGTATAMSMPGPGFAALTVSDTCTACGTCARACPSGALELEIDESARRFTLSFSLQACLGCDVCAHCCPEDAIELDHAPTIADFVTAPPADTVRQGPLARCRRCNVWFATTSNARLCPICTFRRQNPFGSPMPPKLAQHNHASDTQQQERTTLAREIQ